MTLPFTVQNLSAADSLTVTLTATSSQPSWTTSITEGDSITVPANGSSTVHVPVVVTNSDSQAGTLAGGFTYVAATHYYLAEGATVWTFETLLALANPGVQAAPAERAMYWDKAGTWWAAGTAALGTRLR